MEIKEILDCFNHPDGHFPIEAVNAALEKQEAITPHLLGILEHTISNYELIDKDRMDYIFALYLLSKFREKKALPYILALASLPSQWPEDLLGDCITEALARFIVSTFNNDLLSIKKVAENETLNEWSRYAALKSLLGLVALQKLQRAELIAYIRSLFHSSLADDEGFATHLVNIATDLYPEELMDEINYAFEEDKVDIGFIDQDWIKEILTKDKEQCLAENVYDDHHHLPIDDVEKSMCWIIAFYSQQEISKIEHNNWDDIDDNLNFETMTTYVRATPKIGQNDPCQCGSGKKYKKMLLNITS